MGPGANFQKEMRTVKIEAQASSGVEGNLLTFLISDVNGVIGLFQAPIALLLRKHFIALIFLLDLKGS
jgi:hypothetical protein